MQMMAGPIVSSAEEVTKHKWGLQIIADDVRLRDSRYKANLAASCVGQVAESLYQISLQYR